MPTTYEYYAAVLYAFDRIMEGQTPTKACDMANLPYRKFIQLVKEDNELALRYDEANQIGADTMADGLVSIFDPSSPLYESDDKKAKIKSDNAKWLLSRRFNKKYGERVEIKQEVTISHVITSQLEAARQRSLGATAEQAMDYIEAEYVELPPPPRIAG